MASVLKLKEIRVPEDKKKKRWPQDTAVWNKESREALTWHINGVLGGAPSKLGQGQRMYGSLVRPRLSCHVQ